MDGIIGYFSELEKHPLQRGAFFVGSLVLLWAVESAIPLKEMAYKRNKGRHALINVGFTAIHFLIHTILAVFIVMYFVDYFASIWRLLKPFEPLSLFNYYDPTRILVTGEGSLRNLAVLAVIAVASAAAGLGVFRNRDLPT